jgi:hypothetical protein
MDRRVKKKILDTILDGELVLPFRFGLSSFVVCTMVQGMLNNKSN